MSGYDNFRRSADDIDTNLQLTITNRRYAFIYLKGQEGFASTSSADNGTPGDGGEIAFCIDLFSFSDVYNTLTFSGLTGGDGGSDSGGSNNDDGGAGGAGVKLVLSNSSGGTKTIAYVGGGGGGGGNGGSGQDGGDGGNGGIIGVDTNVTYNSTDDFLVSNGGDGSKGDRQGSGSGVFGGSGGGTEGSGSQTSGHDGQDAKGNASNGGGGGGGGGYEGGNRGGGKDSNNTNYGGGGGGGGSTFFDVDNSRVVYFRTYVNDDDDLTTNTSTTKTISFSGISHDSSIVKNSIIYIKTVGNTSTTSNFKIQLSGGSVQDNVLNNFMSKEGGSEEHTKSLSDTYLGDRYRDNVSGNNVIHDWHTFSNELTKKRWSGSSWVDI